MSATLIGIHGYIQVVEARLIAFAAERHSEGRAAAEKTIARGRSCLGTGMWRLGSALYVLAVAASLSLSLGGCRRGETVASAEVSLAPDVSVATVELTEVHEWDEFNGRVSAIGSVEIRPRVSGYIQRVAYSEGEEVKQGDVLFVIDPRPYRDALDSATARLARAQATARLAKLEYVRAQVLMHSAAISHEEFEARRGEYEQDNADVQAAQAAVATAELNVSFTEVRAPISGRTSRAVLTPGNLAQADQTLLTTLLSQDPVYVYFDCDEQSYLRYLALMRQQGHGVQGSVVRVGLSNEAGFPHQGQVSFLDNQVDPATGTLRARATLPNPARQFTPGLFARVELDDRGQFKTLRINERAVITDQERKFVYVLGPNDTAVRRDVQLGRVADSLRVVESGLTAGDKVIVDGIQRIDFTGARVKPHMVAMDGVRLNAQTATN
jgi:membrane fusion protein, multidrug efflux system